MAMMEDNIQKVQETIEGVRKELLAQEVPAPIRNILEELCKAISTTNAIQVEIIAGINSRDSHVALSSANACSSHGVPLHSQARQGNDRSHLKQAPLGGDGEWVQVVNRNQKTRAAQVTAQVDAPVSEEAKKSAKFREAIRESESSILLHGLNMGNSPILNPDTMCTKVTSDLINKAAVCEEKVSKRNNRGIPTQGVIDTLDDLMSMVKHMDFFGKVTKPCRVPGNPELNNTYYSIPVRMRFQDRDTRARAEAILRSTCQVGTTIPYPAILRECMQRTMKHYKDMYQGDYIRVNLELSKMTLKVSRREGSRENKGEWHVCASNIKLPDEVLDVASRKVPAVLPLEFPPPYSGSEMDQEEFQGAQAGKSDNVPSDKFC
jgi:hypothetical protein